MTNKYDEVLDELLALMEGNTLARMNVHVKVDELMLQDVLKIASAGNKPVNTADNAGNNKYDEGEQPMTDMPKEIWVATNTSYCDVWWEGDKINEDDARYTRADIAEKRELKALRERDDYKATLVVAVQALERYIDNEICDTSIAEEALEEIKDD